VLGVSTAVSLARLGARVTLFSEGALGSGASGRSLAWLNSYGRRSPAYHRLRLLGLERYRALERSSPVPAAVRFGGGLTWPGADEVDGHREAYEHMRSLGYPARWLAPDEVARLVPGVDASAVPEAGAILNPDEGWVDLPLLIEGLARELRDLGGEVRTGTGPCEITVADGQVTGVRAADGATVAVEAAVLATGAGVPGTLRALGVEVPDGTTTGLLVRTPAFGTTLQAVLNTPRVAVRPTPDGGVVMDAGWAERSVTTRADGSHDVPAETVEGLLREASAVLEGNPVLRCAEYGVGPKPIPGDGEPVVGAVEGVAGYHVAFTHSGATLGLVVGELLADEVVEGVRRAELDAFRPARFAERRQ
jgi:glycine/D-amino acid oxidase-like deaminating enzyme